MPDRTAALEQDSRRDRLLESRQVDGHRVAAEHQWRARVDAGAVGHEHVFDARVLVLDGDRRAWHGGGLIVSDDAADGGAVGALGEGWTAYADSRAEEGNE